MLVNTIFAMALLGLSTVLLLRHWRHWKRAAGTTRDTVFAWRQLRRRMQASAMIGIVGLAVLVGQFLSVSIGALLYWLIVALFVLWIVLLAMADMIVTRMYLAGSCRNVQFDQARLCAELQRRKETEAGSDTRGSDIDGPECDS